MGIFSKLWRSITRPFRQLMVYGLGREFAALPALSDNKYQGGGQ